MGLISRDGWYLFHLPVIINLSKAMVGSREISFDRKSARNNSLPRRALFFFIEDHRSHERSNNFIPCHLYSTRDESSEKLSSYPPFVIQFRYYLTKPPPFFFFPCHSFESISRTRLFKRAWNLYPLSPRILRYIIETIFDWSIVSNLITIRFNF